MTSNKGAGALMQQALKLYQSGEAIVKEDVNIEPEDAFHSANAVLVRVIERFLDYVQVSWHGDPSKKGWDNEHAVLIVSYGQHVSIPIPLHILKEQGLTLKVKKIMSKIYVVDSGMPAGEVYDREVHGLKCKNRWLSLTA